MGVGIRGEKNILCFEFWEDGRMKELSLKELTRGCGDLSEDITATRRTNAHRTGCWDSLCAPSADLG